MSNDKKIKYESDTQLPSLKMKLADSKTKGSLNASERMYREEFVQMLDKENIVTRIIDHLKERF
jgi:hypothetical protein